MSVHKVVVRNFSEVEIQGYLHGQSMAINTGPDGDNDIQRTLARIQTIPENTLSVTGNESAVPSAAAPASRQRFENLKTASVTAQRTHYFSEVGRTPITL